MKKINVGGNFSFAEKDNPATRLRSPKQKSKCFLEILPIKNNRINISYQYTSKEMMRTMIAVILVQKRRIRSVPFV